MTNLLKTEFQNFLKNNLNPPQLKAVAQKEGALLVVAGAGSGKTRVITSRITNLILEEEQDPSSIVALTFTNKAANEMKQRIIKFLGARYNLPFVGTFHSYCLFLMRSNPNLLPYPQFSIMDTDDKLSLLRKIIKTNALEKYSTPHQLNYQISNIKNGLHADPNDNMFGHPIVKEIYLAYESEKAAAHCFDFDDLILQVLQMFKSEKEFKQRFQQNIKHILVDEYQDTSHSQHDLLKHMALNENNKVTATSLCIVGDEDQSIYSWRGATVTNMLTFKKDFAPVTSIKIEQNYRSVTPILEAANSLIEHNKLRNPKNLWSERKAQDRILSIACRSGEQEADIISNLIKTLPETKKVKDVAILYRTHFQSRILEESLIYHALPYRIVGGIRFYERQEIKDLLAYLRLIVNPFDKISLTRIINVPLRGLGDKFEQQLMQEWIQNPFFDFKELLTNMLNTPEIHDIPTKKREALKNFLSIYDNINPKTSPSQLMDIILKKTDYLAYLRNAFDPKDAETKIENVQEFVRSINMYEFTPAPSAQEFYDTANTTNSHSKKSTDISLENFLYEIALLQEKIKEETTEDHVQLMTLHAAKGLEFDVVIIAGLEEGLLPSSKSLTTNDELEEERRLFYVGITRAKEYLALTHASYRSTFGQITDQVSSRFLSEIDTKHIRTFDAEQRDTQNTRSTLRQWLGLEPLKSDLITFNFNKTTTPATKTTGLSSWAPAGKRSSHKTEFKNTQTISKSSRLKATTSTTPKEILKNRLKEAHARKNQVEEKNNLQALDRAQSGQDFGIWQKNQSVFHKKFGLGVITDIEPANIPDKKDEYYITAIFKIGKKQILSSFLSTK
ncbi:MAG: UvrD-helicase domain-containing protein [bacterium]